MSVKPIFNYYYIISVCIWVEIDNHTFKYFLCCLYRPPNSDSSFWTKLSWSIDQEGEHSDNIIIAGDINVDLLTVPRTHIILEISSTYNLVNNIHEPTRISHTSNTLLDPIFTATDIQVYESGTLVMDSLSTELPPIQISNVNGTTKFVYSDIGKIESLNTYFSSISSVDNKNAALRNMYSLCTVTLCNIYINEQEVLDIISILPVNKAIGPDLVSHKMLKATLSTIVKPLTLLFNRSLVDNTFLVFGKLLTLFLYSKKMIRHWFLIIDRYLCYHVLVKLWKESFLNMCTTIFIGTIYFIDIKPVFYQVIPLFINY